MISDLVLLVMSKHLSQSMNYEYLKKITVIPVYIEHGYSEFATRF
jgi:hypothetical protein